MADGSLNIKPTGIPEFDKILGGGIPAGWFIALRGGAGVGKTTLAIQFLLEGILKYHDPGLLVTFNEPLPALNAIMRNYGWDLQGLQDMGELSVLDFSSTEMGIMQQASRLREASLDYVTQKIIDEVRRLGVNRLVIDPLNTFSLLFRDLFEVRKELHRVIGILWGEQCTTLAVYENTDDAVTDIHNPQFSTEDFLSYGVINLQYILVNSSRERAIEILKMRGMNHSKRVHPYDIGGKGISIKVDKPINFDKT
ncbi:MAG: RAD55 family ATPase [Candidatus Hodarchaeales archaeon]|jgi:KaiC/GvpD/RAD55 family RecA-like ATPase